MNFDFGKLNSMTKYPEILTYHKMGEKGKLTPELSDNLISDKLYHISEKVDGTNTRMIFIIEDDYIDWFIGSRENILSAKNDRIYDPAENIVENIIDICKEIEDKIFYNRELFSNGVYTIYSELYGGKFPATKQYTKTKKYALRTFDISYLDFETFDNLMERERRQIATWRQNGAQYFLNTERRINICNTFNLNMVPFITNRLGKEVPIDIKETYNFLQEYAATKAGIDYDGGKSEGIIIRSDDRKQIVKLRFEDYERTLRN